MEDNITIEELYIFQNAIHRVEHRSHRFSAALKGINLDDADDKKDTFERIKMQAEAALAGKTEEEFVFDMVGLKVETDEE